MVALVVSIQVQYWKDSVHYIWHCSGNQSFEEK